MLLVRAESTCRACPDTPSATITHQGTPMFSCPAHAHKGWENVLSIDLWVTNTFQWADYVAVMEAVMRMIGGIYLLFSFLCALTGAAVAPRD